MALVNHDEIRESLVKLICLHLTAKGIKFEIFNPNAGYIWMYNIAGRTTWNSISHILFTNQISVAGGKTYSYPDILDPKFDPEKFCESLLTPSNDHGKRTAGGEWHE